MSHIPFYLEDDDHIPVDFIGETIGFTCQLMKLWKIEEHKYDSMKFLEQLNTAIWSKIVLLKNIGYYTILGL